MAISISSKREYEFTGSDENNDPCLFPRHPVNHVFVQAFNFRTKKIAEEAAHYLAFPFLVKIGTTLVGIHSDSDSHASGSSQNWIKSTDDGVTWASGLALDSGVGVFDPSFLTGLLAIGESVTLKVWTIKNVAGTLTVYTNGTVSYGGLTYAMWSRTSPATGGKLYRTGYATNGADTQTALFESSNGGQTWIGKAVMFATGGRQYNEADIVNTSGTNWLSVVREETGASNILYYSTSTDDGATWSAPVAYTTAVNGRQPNLTKMTDGSIILATGDRSGTAGYGGSGEQLYGFDTTGVAVFRTAPVLCGANPVSTVSPGSSAVRIVLVGHGLATGNVIEVSGATGPIDGIPAAQINRFQTITVISANVIEFTVTSTATVGGVAGGGSVVKLLNASVWGYRTRLSPIYTTDGGQPMVVETSTANRICCVFYARRSVRQTPIIAGASLDVANL